MNLFWKSNQTWKRSINHHKVNCSASAKMSGCKSTNRDAMNSNFYLKALSFFYGELPRPIVHDLHITSKVWWVWLSCAFWISSVIPKHDINAIIQVEVWPLWAVMLHLSIPHVWVANNHCFVPCNFDAWLLLKPGWRRQEKCLNLLAIWGLEHSRIRTILNF